MMKVLKMDGERSTEIINSSNSNNSHFFFLSPIHRFFFIIKFQFGSSCIWPNSIDLMISVDDDK